MHLLEQSVTLQSFLPRPRGGACGLEGSREEPRAALYVVPTEVTPGQKVPSRVEWLRAKLWVVQPCLCGAEPGLPRFTFRALNSPNGEADGEIQEDTTKDQAGLSIPKTTAAHTQKYPGSTALPWVAGMLPCHQMLLQEAGEAHSRSHSPPQKQRVKKAKQPRSS